MQVVQTESELFNTQLPILKMHNPKKTKSQKQASTGT